MSTIKVDTIATRTGSGNITLSNNVASLTSAGAISGTNLTASGTLAVTGATTLSSNLSLVKNQAAHTNIDVFNNSGSASAKGQIRVGYDAANCLEIFRVGNNANIIQNATQNGAIIFQGAGTEMMRMSTAGLAIGGTGAANTLDDYEEGTWTPNIGGSGVAYGTQTGVYRKIGSMVYVYCQISINAIGSPTTTNSILGMPFSTTSVANQYFGVAYYNGINNNTYEFHGNFRSDASIRMEGKTSFGTGQASAHNWAQNGASIYGSGWFFTA